MRAQGLPDDQRANRAIIGQKCGLTCRQRRNFGLVNAENKGFYIDSLSVIPPILFLRNVLARCSASRTAEFELSSTRSLVQLRLLLLCPVRLIKVGSDCLGKFALAIKTI